MWAPCSHRGSLVHLSVTVQLKHLGTQLDDRPDPTRYERWLSSEPRGRRAHHARAVAYRFPTSLEMDAALPHVTSGRAVEYIYWSLFFLTQSFYLTI